jgi:hypothetical protein
MGLTKWESLQVLCSSPANCNFNFVVRKNIINSIAMVEGTTITNSQFMDKIVDVFTDADGKLNTVSVANTTMFFNTNRYENCLCGWLSKYICCSAEGCGSVSNCCTRAVGCLANQLWTSRFYSESIPAKYIKYITFDYSAQISYCGGATHWGEACFISPTICYHRCCCGSVSYNPPAICLVCVSENCFECFVGGASGGCVEMCVWCYCLYSAVYLCNGACVGTTATSLISSAEINIEIIPTIIETHPQAFASTKNSIFLTIVDTESNYDNITYDVFNASDTKILCNGEINKPQTLTTPSDCLKVQIKAGDSALNKITKYGYIVGDL